MIVVFQRHPYNKALLVMPLIFLHQQENASCMQGPRSRENWGAMAPLLFPWTKKLWDKIWTITHALQLSAQLPIIQILLHNGEEIVNFHDILVSVKALKPEKKV